MLILGACISLINIPVISLVQEQTEKEKIGRVMSLSTMVSMGLIPISYGAVSGLLSTGIPISWILLFSGCVLFLFSALVFWKAKVLKATD
ncbi:hypothetical protein [Polycladomyces subterraneus]|uniref:Major facilitator superfamily (MFS) profile domain-containing protein n=1 Tax=Polycladomyces subterraneus TaxID=1016997 RepID=A0ABT8IR22_9BACL|nr:hypothetical protein [Polycladomyces subterraneus]MDN4595195.1 hypothetical protein [Polycladomyces subterraneus]